MYKKYKRIFLIVLDSVGIGATKDANLFNSQNANTLLHTIQKNNQSLPNFEKMGLLNLIDIKTTKTNAYYTKASPVSRGKDTLTGHLEMMGVETTKPLQTFTETGFPKELITELETKTNRKVLGNKSASGTEIIKELGQEQMKTKGIIVYTSADSVLQIAASEQVIPVSELYEICQIARDITLKEEWKVGRVIARPFIYQEPNYIRTSNRRDFALNPPKKTTLNYLQENNLQVISIGKIADIFNGSGLTKKIKTKDNQDGLLKIKEVLNQDFTGLCFANLNDFDSKYGHRRDFTGYMQALVQVDETLPDILNNIKDDDLLIITADHGNDPTYEGTDHTREMIPILIYNPQFKNPTKLNDLDTFADIGATIADNFNTNYDIGTTFLEQLK